MTRKCLLFFSALALAACNGGGSGVAEEISASPATINAEYGQKNYTIDVASNCHWSVTAVNQDGSETTWLTLLKKSGSGNVSVGVRVNANEYKTERTSNIVFTTDGGETASVTLTQQANGSGVDPAAVDMRIGSYNIRMSGLDSGDNAWSVRKPRLWTSIENCNFDIFGLQEVSTTAQNDLKSQFGSTYGMYFFSPYAANGNGDKAHGVMYRSAKFTMSDLHYFWMGPDPSTMSKSDTGESGEYNRGGFCCVITHKETGVKLFFMCTHGCLNDAPNAAYAHIYADMEKKYNTESLPSIFVGDMNASTTEAPYLEYAAYWKDSFLNVTNKSGSSNTYNGYSSPSGKSRIDYVFYRGKAVPQSYTCDNQLYGGLYASDHFPVYVDFKISK
ncbi:MAG: endonuclease/exonuclease/phosphatase family protein [Bacteroidales bacterium]|nr:endonuclease/exonuclease/phosphatase family protein [Bacteroidales bacterium]